MKKCVVVIFTDGKLSRRTYKAACSQDYGNCDVLISVHKADPKRPKHENMLNHMNYARKLATATDGDYFFFIDADVVIPKNAVTKLMSQFEQPEFRPELWQHLVAEHGEKAITPPAPKHIIGAWCKVSPTKWNICRWIGNTNIIAPLGKVETSLVRVDSIGSGSIAMSREVLEKIPWRLDYSLKINEHEGKFTIPCKCIIFGDDAKAAGYELYAYGDIVCDHLSVADTWRRKLARVIMKYGGELWTLKTS